MKTKLSRGTAAVSLLIIFCSAMAVAQSTEMPRGSKEGETFFQGGHSVPGGRGNTGVFAAGFRFGHVLLSAPKQNFEYSIELIPVYVFTQRQNTYGASFTPINLKYNLTAFRRVVPYIELGGGVLFTNHDVPDRTNNVNFTSQAGIGMHIPIKPGSNRHIGVALKYIHVSNAGLARPNPGLNTVLIKLSVGHFCSPRAGNYVDQTAKCKYYHY